MKNPIITKKAAQALKLGANGSYSDEGQILQHTLYDSAFFQDATLAAKTSFFTVPQGGAKTLTETNMEDSGKLPNGNTFMIESFGIALKCNFVGTDGDVNTVLSAYYNIIQNSIFEVIISGRAFDLQLPGSRLLTPIPVSDTGTMVDATTRLAGDPNLLASGWYKLPATPIPVANLVSFKVDMISGSGLAALAAILDTASDVLNTQKAQIEVRLGGTLTRLI